ncbi:single-stranded DNA-binding protein [Luteipulveratus sp. YIM 133132]|uniref:Single-stranded DNA-binding protein n=1 Tax=Luteipulveratus flavus TaxID=3031728 RepID=A0ABT6C9H4_9MICO|nr:MULTISPECIES: single-stranded DNA-binding protein [unclassified Luteipulveratus]MDE9366295.1 single-stranded DNA-binding protein [Luteipulveratus sp. YIM 133132]MDF8265386.1 single-stranded DNA-binding protein [Luteipulveratus sp. YIM 133296]
MLRTQVTIAGNLVGEPDMRATKKGEPFASMRIAVNARKKDAESGAWVNYATSFYNVSAFNNLAINALNSLHKGEPVVVFGELRVREYTGQHGETQRSIDITAEHIGHDLSQGRAQFAREARPRLDRFAEDEPAAPGEEPTPEPYGDVVREIGLTPGDADGPEYVEVGQQAS